MGEGVLAAAIAPEDQPRLGEDVGGGVGSHPLYRLVGGEVEEVRECGGGGGYAGGVGAGGAPRRRAGSPRRSPSPASTQVTGGHAAFYQCQRAFQ